MGKQNGKKVSQKQRSQKKSSSLKKYKKKRGSSQKGGLGYRYQLLVGKEEGGMTGTREGFISDIFKMIKNNNNTTFKTFSDRVINPYTKQKVLNERYSDEDVIQNIIVPYFFNLPGTNIKGQVAETESAEEGQEEAETESAGEEKKSDMFSSFSSMFGNKKKGETSPETPEQKTSTELDCNKYTQKSNNKVLNKQACNYSNGCRWANDSEQCMPENRVDEKGKLIPFQQLRDKCEGVQQINADATFKKARCNTEPGCTWDEDTENCIPKISGGTLTETPTIPENTKKDLGIADNVVISAFQYAILKGNYDLVNGIFGYMQQHNGGGLLKEYVKEPLAKSNGNDISLTQPYYLPFTQGYYTEDLRLLIGTSNVTVNATTMEQFVDLFKNYAPNYTSINYHMGGKDVTVEDIKKIIDNSGSRRKYNSKFMNLKNILREGEIPQNQKEIIKKNIFPDNNNVNFKDLTDEQMDPIIDAIIRILISNAKKESKQNTDQIKMLVIQKLQDNTAKQLINLITVQEEEEEEEEEANAKEEEETSQALVLPGSKNNDCIYKEAKQCDSTNSKEVNKKLKVEYESKESKYFDPKNNLGCDPNKNVQQIYDSVTGPALANAVENCNKVIRSQGPETTDESGPQQNTELKAITDGSTESQQTREGENVITNESGQQQNTELKAITDGPTKSQQTGVGENKDESGPQQTSSIPVSSNTEINDLIALLQKLVSQDKIPKVSFDNNELRIVSASSADQQLGDQEEIAVDLTKSAKQLNITYLTTDNEEKQISIVLYGPKTAEEIAQQDNFLRYYGP